MQGGRNANRLESSRLPMKGRSPIAGDARSLASWTSVGFGAIATDSNRQSYSRTHVAVTILASLIAFGSAPTIAAAQSHCRSAHPTETRSGLTAPVFTTILMEVGTLVNSETTKEVDRARSRLPAETNMSANGVMAKKMDMALTHSSAVTNTLAIGGIAKETGGALKRTLMEVATLANGGTIKKMDEAPKRTLMEVATLASSEATKEMGRAC
jgi:hypothetical protein